MQCKADNFVLRHTALLLSVQRLRGDRPTNWLGAIIKYSGEKFMKVSCDTRKITVTQTDLAKALNLSRQRITQLIQEKIILRDETDPSGGVFLFDSLKNYWLKAVEKSGDDYFKVKTEHEEVKKNLSEVKLRQLEGDLYLAVDVENALAEILVTLRTNLLSLPAKFASQLENKSSAEISAILTEEIEDKLQELSSLKLGVEGENEG